MSLYHVRTYEQTYKIHNNKLFLKKNLLKMKIIQFVNNWENIFYHYKFIEILMFAMGMDKANSISLQFFFQKFLFWKFNSNFDFRLDWVFVGKFEAVKT